VASGAHDVLDSQEFSKLRVLIVHDWLVTWAGAERCLEQLVAIFPQADVVVGILSDEMRSYNDVTQRARQTWVGSLPGSRSHHRWFVPLEALAFQTLSTRDYDLVISSCHSFAKAVRPTGGAVHLSYCYSPPRYLWDMYGEYRAAASPIQRCALSISQSLMRSWDKATASCVTEFIAISACVAERIGRIYSRSAHVVYPPVQARSITSTDPGLGQYLLYLGRLVPYKRIDLAIAAAERLGIKLVIAGEGPELHRLQRQAGPRTKFLGRVSEPEAAGLLDHCVGFVFCAEEDFGIAPLEANAHGKPVVAYGKGASQETMVDGVTATLFHEQSVDSLAGGMDRLLRQQWDPVELRKNAKRFSPAVFRDRFRSVVNAALS
jgi:glycosyltransferase involved in cell wall biosynthesis